MKRHNTSIGHEPSKRFQQLPNQERHPRSPEEQTSRRPYDGGVSLFVFLTSLRLFVTTCIYRDHRQAGRIP